MYRKGTTLVELCIAMFLVVIISGSVFTLFIQSRKNYERPRASMVAQEEMMRVVHALQQDLEETNIQSVRSFPASGGSSIGLSLESGREPDGPAGGTTPPDGLAPDAGQNPDEFPTASAGSLGVNFPLGTVTWKKYVYYLLQPIASTDPNLPGVGRLIRFERPLSDQGSPPCPTRLIPIGDDQDPATVLPSLSQTRVLATDILLPHQTIAGVGVSGDSGGFQVGFEPNPSLPAPLPLAASGALTGYDDTNRSVPIVVNLAVADVGSATGKVTVNTFQMHLVPRN